MSNALNTSTADTAYTKERFLIPAPLPVRPCAPPITREPGAPVTYPLPESAFGVYLDEHMNRMRWSAHFPLPSIGDRIKIAMNGVGMGKVVGYFSSPSGGAIYLGVMALPEKPPAWLREQVKREEKDLTCPKWMREGIGCFFGTEIKLIGVRSGRHKG